MRRLRPLLALLLLPLWFAATVHCGLEVVGELLSHEHGAGNLCNDKGSCARDACDLLEDSAYRSDVAGVSVPSFPPAGPDVPSLADARHLIGPSLLRIEVYKPPVDYEAPSRPDWQFERRAAPWPGAPGIGRA